MKGFVQLELLAAAAAVSVLMAVGAIWYAYDAGHDAGYAEAYGEVREVEIAMDAKEDTASGALEVDREKVRTVYRNITREVDRVVEKPVYRSDCFDPDGVRLANAALAGAFVPAGEPDRGVPGSGSATGRELGDGSPPVRRPGEGLPGLPGEASPAR